MIKRARIQGFKSIADVTLDLDPVTVLIGRNGTGKSNLVRALRFLRNILHNQNQAVTDEGGWERIVPAGETNPRTSVELTFSVPGEDRDYQYELAFQPPPGQKFPCPIALHTERLSLGPDTVYARARAANFTWGWTKPPNVSPLPSHADSPLLGSFPALQHVVFAYAALATGIGYYHLPSDALLHAQQHAQGVQRALQGLHDDAANYRDVIRSITQDFHHPHTRKNLVASLHALNPAVQSVELDSLLDPKQAIVAHKAGDRIFELSLEQESDGFRRFYAHLLALYQVPPKLTLIFEEPENAIHPGALSLLADEFKAAPPDNRGQVILTTHSPSLLDSFDIETIRAVEMRDGKTLLGPVSQEQRQAIKDGLLKTGELLTVDRARLADQAQSQPAA